MSEEQSALFKVVYNTEEFQEEETKKRVTFKKQE